MEAGEDQNSGSTNGNTQSGGNTRPPQIAHMSLYERQAVQALQALQRQPNAAQYFQQLMLQQQINTAQLNLAAVQQATLAASRQSSSPSNSVSQATSTTQCTVNLTTTAAAGTMTNPRPMGPATSVSSSALTQPVLLGGSSTGQGQNLYLRVNRPLRAPLASQLIFMPGGTATAAVATVAQQQPQQQQQQPQQQQQQQQQQQVEVPPIPIGQTDNDQVQNLAMRCVSTSRVAAIKTEFPERKEAAGFSIPQQQQQPQQYPQAQHQSPAPQQQQQQQQQQQTTPQQLTNPKLASYAHPNASSLPGALGVKGVSQPNMATNAATGAAGTTGGAGASGGVAGVPPSSSPSPSLPLSQLLLSPGLCQARAVTTVTPAATVTHILVPTSSVPTSSQGYAVGTVGTAKATLGAQTLVVQPMQQQPQQQGVNNDKLSHSATPVPIQPKGVQSHRLPMQMPPRHPPPILPAPPSNGQPVAVQGQGQHQHHHPPHVPVQLVGARQGTLGNTQAVALAQARNCFAQDAASTLGNGSATTLPTANGNGNSMVTMVTSLEAGTGGMCLKTPQSAVPAGQLSGTQQAGSFNHTHSSTSTPSAVCLPNLTDGHNHTPVSAVAPSSGDSVFMHSGPTPTKPLTTSLKRKSESDTPDDLSGEPLPNCCPSLRDSAPPLSPAPSLDTAPEMAFSSPPTLLPLPRGGGCQGDRAPLPQAVVKPQVLTHLIEGFVIQEGAEPFPVTGPVKEHDVCSMTVGVPPNIHSEGGHTAVLKCEYCQNYAPASQFGGTKRFCSKTCAKRYNVSCSHHFRSSRGRVGPGVPPLPPPDKDAIARRRGPRRSSSEIACAKIAGRHLPMKCRSESSRSEDISSCDGEEEEDSLSHSPSSSFSCPPPTHCGSQLDGSTQGGLSLDGSHFLSASPAHWSVDEVCQFISSLQGCEDLAPQFLSQEIDGQALLLLKEEHLMSTMNIKLGPALKICASINNLRD